MPTQRVASPYADASQTSEALEPSSDWTLKPGGPYNGDGLQLSGKHSLCNRNSWIGHRCPTFSFLFLLEKPKKSLKAVRADEGKRGRSEEGKKIKIKRINELRNLNKKG